MVGVSPAATVPPAIVSVTMLSKTEIEETVRVADVPDIVKSAARAELLTTDSDIVRIMALPGVLVTAEDMAGAVLSNPIICTLSSR